MDKAKALDTSLSPIIYLWQDLVLFIGRLAPNEFHRNAVDTLAINLEGQFKITIDEGETWDECRSVFWPNNLPHQSVFDNDIVVFFFIEPSSPNYGNFVKSHMKKNKNYYIDLESEEYAIHNFIQIFNERPEPEIAHELLMKAINPHTGLDEIREELDDRVLRTINLIREKDFNFLVSELAKNIELSTSRLEHLFKQETGMSIARYRQWDKIKKFTRSISYGKNLTEAALDVGFTDGSHFSRTFKYLIGVKPTLFYQAPNFTHIFVSDEYK
jgi:AraC-like DNA-binding protein